MDRLTVNDLNKVCYDPWELCGMDNYCKKGCHEEGGCTKFCHILKMYRKLAEYETLEEQGKLLKLQVAVGDTVYVLAECENIPTRLDGTLYGENGEPGTATGYYCPYENDCPFDGEEFEDCDKYKNKTAVFEDTVLFITCDENGICAVTEKCAVSSPIGLYIFLTKESAEAALKEMSE